MGRKNTIIIMLGAPGSGKGTISQMLAKKLKFTHISAGDVIREEVSKKTTLGLKLREFEEIGLLAPTEIVNKIMSKVISKNKGKNLILDGYPRDIKQAKFIQSIKDVNLVINLKVSKDAIINRLANRRICPKGHIYHLKNMPPKKRGICDKDGLKLIKRPDDNPKTIRIRFKEYGKLTKPLIKYYNDLNLLRIVNANGLPEDITKDVAKVAKERLK